MPKQHLNLEDVQLFSSTKRIAGTFERLGKWVNKFSITLLIIHLKSFLSIAGANDAWTISFLKPSTGSYADIRRK
jgi:hypothetical protein